jgi:hypothetical protein
LRDGEPELLQHLRRTKLVHEQRRRPMPASNPLVRNCVERGEKVPNSHPVNVLISLNMHGGNKVEENIDSDDA